MDLIYFVKYAYVFCDAKHTNSSRIIRKKYKNNHFTESS